MADGKRQTPWSEEETLAALWLLHNNTASKISQSGGLAADLAALLPRRNTGAVAYKIMNLAHLDPNDPRKRLEHHSKLDKAIAERYQEDREGTVEDARAAMQRIVRRAPRGPGYALNPLVLAMRSEGPTEGLAIRKVRRKQAFFRHAVRIAYEGKCAVTGLDNVKMLEASHIRPWASSEGELRVNPRNGLYLNALHHKAYDLGEVTVTPDGIVLVSDATRARNDSASRFLASHAGERIRQSKCAPAGREYLDYHYREIFKGSPGSGA